MKIQQVVNPFITSSGGSNRGVWIFLIVVAVLVGIYFFLQKNHRSYYYITKIQHSVILSFSTCVFKLSNLLFQIGNSVIFPFFLR